MRIAHYCWHAMFRCCFIRANTKWNIDHVNQSINGASFATLQSPQWRERKRIFHQWQIIASIMRITLFMHFFQDMKVVHVTRYTLLCVRHYTVCPTLYCVSYTVLCVAHCTVCSTQYCVQHTGLCVLHWTVCTTLDCVYYTGLCVGQGLLSDVPLLVWINH